MVHSVELLFDLDTEAAETAERLGLTMRRVPTVGVDPEFAEKWFNFVVAEVIRHHTAAGAPEGDAGGGA